MESPAKRRRVWRNQGRLRADDGDRGFGKLQVTKETVVHSTPVPTTRPTSYQPLLLREKRGEPRRLGLRHKLVHRQEMDAEEAKGVSVITVIRQIDQAGNTVGIRTMSSMAAPKSSDEILPPSTPTPAASSSTSCTSTSLTSVAETFDATPSSRSSSLPPTPFTYSSQPATTPSSPSTTIAGVPTVQPFPTSPGVPSVPSYPFNTPSIPGTSSLNSSVSTQVPATYSSRSSTPRYSSQPYSRSSSSASLPAATSTPGPFTPNASSRPTPSTRSFVPSNTIPTTPSAIPTPLSASSSLTVIPFLSNSASNSPEMSTSPTATSTASPIAASTTGESVSSFPVSSSAPGFASPGTSAQSVMADSVTSSSMVETSKSSNSQSFLSSTRSFLPPPTTASISSSSEASSPFPLTSTPEPTSTAGTFIAGGGGTTTAGGKSTSGADNGGNKDSGATTPQIIGGVIGGLCGFAVLLIVALVVLRWYKQRQKRPQQLGAAGDNPENPFADPTAPAYGAKGGQGMSQRSGPFAVGGFLSRLSGNRQIEPPPPPGERGFQRISGRKLPSAFSPGMTSDDPFGDENASATSFAGGARVANNLHGGYGTPPMSPLAAAVLAGAAAGPSTPGFPPDRSATPGTPVETLRPSPARIPVVHQSPRHPSMFTGPDEVFDLPPRPGSRGTLGRSLGSHDGSRGSKFTEDV